MSVPFWQIHHAEPGRWTLSIEGWTPCLDNRLVGTHPMIAHKRKKWDAEVLDLVRACSDVPRAEHRRRITLTMQSPWTRPPDDTAPLKSFCDALTNAGLIVDDSREWLELVFPPTFLRGARRTVIEIEDLPRPAMRYPDEDTAEKE